MKNKVAVIYNSFYDFRVRTFSIGGIQSYLHSLIGVLKRFFSEVVVFQSGEYSADVVMNDFRIVQICCKDAQDYITCIYKTEANIDLAIFATYSMIPKNNPFSKSIAIQHGIDWDMPRMTSRPFLLMRLSKFRRDCRIIKKIKNVDGLVCVDYNFVNWLRSEVDRVDNKVFVIPNYTHIASPFVKPSDSVNIIFARRFWWYRGTRVFTRALLRLLNEGFNLNVTIAGSGPDEEWMKEQFKGYDCVSFISYSSNQSLAIHADKHIAVVPTIGSEGTSLSLLEAMSAQCAVVCSDVGGMTNIILNGYNGIIVPSGSEDELYAAVKQLLLDGFKREQIANRGYDSVKEAFSFSRWEKEWTHVLSSFT